MMPLADAERIVLERLRVLENQLVTGVFEGDRRTVLLNIQSCYTMLIYIDTVRRGFKPIWKKLDETQLVTNVIAKA